MTADFLGEPAAREFVTIAEGQYRLRIPDVGVQLDIDRLRRERHELVGELTVSCDLPGVRTIDGVLSIGTFNLSSPTARAQRAKLLREQGDTELDFALYLEELCQRTIAAERTGSPSVPLHTFPTPDPDAIVNIEGFPILRDHAQILFGDGGSLKSYLELYFAGQLARRGLSVGMVDWELDGPEHRGRLERVFGITLPLVHYLRADRPLIDEVDRVKRAVEKHRIDFLFFDSIAYAVNGPPEAAEHAMSYFRAIRQIGVGSLHIAHVNKSEQADQKPFGSSFWHNSARSTWFVKQASTSPDGRTVSVGLFQRKSNLTRPRPPIGFEFAFTETQTQIRRVDVADVADLAAQMTVRQRMTALLSRGAMSAEAVADEIDKDVETVKRTARRYREHFVTLPGGKLALLERNAS